MFDQGVIYQKISFYSFQRQGWIVHFGFTKIQYNYLKKYNFALDIWMSFCKHFIFFQIDIYFILGEIVPSFCLKMSCLH